MSSKKLWVLDVSLRTVLLFHRTPIVPVFTFGETDLYDQVPNPPGSWLLWLQERIRRVIGVAPCIPIGRGFFQYSFGLIPRRHVLTTVGKLKQFGLIPLWCEVKSPYKKISLFC